jgi:vitamin B12 transporter
VATATVGQDGQYRLTVPPGARVELRVRMDGFAEESTRVTASAGTTRDFTLGIAPFNDSIVVTPSGTARSAATVSESLTVFTSDDIAELGSHSVADIVTQIPGLDIGATGREGSETSLFSRGGESDYNHVLIDGVRVNINGGQFDFSRVSAAEIDRVEVVRGAQSARYGSDAIGSVVQIFTKRGSPRGGPQLSGSVEGGSFATFRGDVRLLGGVQDRVDYQLGVAQRSTNGAFADILADDDEFDQTSVDGNVGARLNDRASLRTGVRYANAKGHGVGAIDYAPGDTGQVYDTEDLSWHLNFDGVLTSAVTHRADVNVFRYESFQEDTVGDAFPTLYTILEGTPGALFPDSPRLARIIDEGEFNGLLANPTGLGPNQFLASTPFGVFFGDSPFEFASSFRRYEFDYQLDATWLDNQVLSTGYQYLEEQDPTEALFSVNNHAFFAQQQLTLQDRLFVTVGARVDDNSRFGTEVSPKLSAAAFPVPFRSGPVSSVKLFANLGRGVKNPTFGELFPSGFSDGNPNLKPERARTFDAGAELTFDDQRWMGRVTVFDNDFEDQVAFLSSNPDFTPDGIPDSLNIAGSEASGVELEFGLQRPIGGLTASASYALVDTEVVATTSTSEQFQPGQPLLRRPKHSGTVRLSYTQGRASVHLNLRAVGERHDAAFADLFTPDFQSVDITVNPAYTVISLGGRYRVREALTVFLQIDNLGDERYSTALGYPAMPRAVVVGGRFSVGQ